MPKSTKIALFGGTFDPVHKGHLEVAEGSKEALGLDRVIFLPCRQSPHKSVAAGASEEHRLEMLKLATLNLPWAEVSDYEYQQPIPSYSWRTAEAFLARFSGAKLYWLMGYDQWEVLPTWNRFEYLAELVTFIVYARRGKGVAAERVVHGDSEVSFVEGDHPASSTAIRRAFAEGTAPVEEWLPKRVSDFMRLHKIYQE